MLLGVGLGRCRAEAAAVGYEFGERAARTDEAIVVHRRLWSAEEPLDGRWWRFAGLVSSPTPVRSPGVPITVGGSLVAAARRAGRLGDGYSPTWANRSWALCSRPCAMPRRAPAATAPRSRSPARSGQTSALVRLGVGRVVVSVRDTRPDVLERVIRFDG